MDPAEIFGTILAVSSALAGLIVWVIKALLAPFKVVIENNTRVMERIEAKLEDHSDMLDEHGNRLTKIETAHRVIHGEKE